MDQASKFCGGCQRQVLAARPGTNHVLHLILTVLTVGLWLIPWLLSCVKIGGWKCQTCGSRVS